MTTGVVFDPFYVIYDENTCPVTNCNNPRYLEQFCKTHVKQFNTMRFRNWCAIEGCRAKGHGLLCREHAIQYIKGEVIRPLTYRRVRDKQNRKRCGTCDVWRPEDEFCKDAKSSDGRASNCKRCVRLRIYNISEDEYIELLEQQGNSCMICKSTNPGPTDWHVDHDHSCCPGTKSCGECVRGILCHSCNIGLGFFRDNANSLERAIKYLDVEERSSLHHSK